MNLFLSLPLLSLSFSVTLEERISRRLLLKLALFCQSRVHEEFHFYVDHVYASHGEACVYIYKRAYHFLHFANCCFCEVHDERITNQLPFANRSNLFMVNKQQITEAEVAHISRVYTNVLIKANAPNPNTVS